jgi:hypothetical protein
VFSIRLLTGPFLIPVNECMLNKCIFFVKI